MAKKINNTADLAAYTKALATKKTAKKTITVCAGKQVRGALQTFPGEGRRHLVSELLREGDSPMAYQAEKSRRSPSPQAKLDERNGHWRTGVKLPV